MKTKHYNPSPFEVEIAKAIKEAKDELQNHMDTRIESIDVKDAQDNPDLLLKLRDTDGDYHEIVIKIIQRPDDKVQK